MKSLLAFYLCLTLTAASIAESDGHALIVSATQHYVAANSGIQKMHIVVERVEGSYARTKVAPADANAADAAWVFLKKEHGAWIGLTLGTSFNSNDYRRLGIPLGLWLK
ncbi:MAG: hypothetical protein M3Y69_10080 [Verrucomicrobiota bacterium]|nr:hypothetical protein [Verrucomicrobiota bacterium]